MPSTPAERKALALITAVAALGVVVRVVRAREARPVPTTAETRALDAQIARVESARAAGRGGGRGSPRPRRATPKRDSNAVQLPPRESPRLPVDLDVASAGEIESLPWIGAALAARIVENRDRCGPFGSLQSLTRVYGIGAGTTRRLESHVTFSGGSRPIVAGRAPGCQDTARGAASRRRGRS